MSVSKMRSVAANGNSRVIPAQAGIQEVARMSVSKMRSVAANGNSRVIPAQAGIQDQSSSNPVPR
jgi:hypothetical protein